MTDFITLYVELGNTEYEVEFEIKYKVLKQVNEGHGLHTEESIEVEYFDFFFDDPSEAVIDAMHEMLCDDLDSYKTEVIARL